MLRNESTSFVADRVLPPAMVNSRTGKFYTIGDGFSFASPGHGIVRTSGAAFNRLTMDVSQTSAYTLKEYGLEAPVDDVDASYAAADQVSLREGTTELAWNASMIERERDAAALLFNASVITQTSALSGASRWDNSASDPRDQALLAGQTVQKSIGIPRRKLSCLMGAEVFDQVVKNGALLQYFQSQVPGTTFLTEQQLAQALGVAEVIVGDAVGNSAEEGQTASNAYIWGKSCLFFYVVPNPRPMAPHGIGATFQMRGRPQGRVERYREEPRLEIVLPTWNEDRVVTTAAAGYLFTTVVS